MDVRTADLELFCVADAMVSKAALPDWHLRGEAAGETAFDEADGTFERDGFGREREMDVIGHDDEGVEFVVAEFAVVLNGFDQE